MLTEEKKELAEKVLAAYKATDDGDLYKWAGRTFIRDRRRFPEWSTGYIGAIHATITTVICKMIEDGRISLKEVVKDEQGS